MCEVAKVIAVVAVRIKTGNGTEQNPNRYITQYWSTDGNLLAINDPNDAVDKNSHQENASGRSILTNLTDREIYNAWKVELGIKGISPEDLLAQYEAAGMTEYVQKFREVIQKMEVG